MLLCDSKKQDLQLCAFDFVQTDIQDEDRRNVPVAHSEWGGFRP